MDIGLMFIGISTVIGFVAQFILSRRIARLAEWQQNTWDVIVALDREIQEIKKDAR